MSLPPAVRQVIASLSGDPARLPDPELLARFVAGRDEAAFAALVGRHAPAVLGACRRALGHAQDAEDAAQAVFLVLARSARSVRKPEALSAWLHGVAVQVSRRALALRRKADPLPEAVAVEAPDPTWADARRVIDESLAALPESLRLPLVLCYLEGLTRDEAAARLGLPAETVRGRLARGRDKLRALLARRGFPLVAGLLAVQLESPAEAAPAWVGATAALATRSAPPPPAVASLSAGVLPMKLSRYWLAAGAVAALACGGVLWAAATPPPAAPAPPQPAPAAEEPVPLLPKDRTGVWRAAVVSADGNKIDHYAIRFTSATEVVWEWHGRSPGVDNRSGMRYQYALVAGKLRLTALAQLQADGLEWTPVPAMKPPPIDYTILPFDKEGNSFQLMQENARGRKALDVVFRKEKEAPPADSLVPEYLTKIDRTIKKQPKYVNDPKYLLVAFGEKAEFKVWVVLDGDVVYIDRNGNGDLTEEGEREELKVREKNLVRQAGRGLTHRLPDANVTVLFAGWIHSDQGRTGGFVGVHDGERYTQTAGGNELNYAPSPEQAAVVHFGSKIVTVRPSLRTAVERDWRCAIPDANGEDQVLYEFGTPGVGPGNKAFGAGSFATFTHSDPPKCADPVAEYEFTPLNPAEGLKKVTVKLTGRVGQTEFTGKVTVPDGVKTGLSAAKVTLSFPDCPWGKVEPVTFPVDVAPKRK